MDNSSRAEVILEQVNEKFDAILEYVQDIPDIRRRVIRLEEDMERVKADLAVIKPAVTQHSKDIVRLKAKAFGA